MLDRVLALQRFALRKVPAAPYSAMRIGFGLCSIWILSSVFPDSSLLLSPDGLGPLNWLSTLVSGPRDRLCLFLWPGGASAEIVLGVGILSGIFFTLGFQSRFSNLVLWLVLVSVRNRLTWVILDGTISSVTFALFFLLFTPTGAYFSIDCLLEKKKSRQATALVLYLFQLQYCLAYSVSAFYKLMGAEWVQGRSIPLVMANPAWRHFDFDFLWNIPLAVPSMKATTWLVLVWELTFPIMICFKKTRRVAIVMGVFFHVGLWVTLNLGVFPVSMLVGYLAFVPPESLHKLCGGKELSDSEMVPGEHSVIGRFAFGAAVFHLISMLWVAWPGRPLHFPEKPEASGFAILRPVESTLVACRNFVETHLGPVVKILDVYTVVLGLDQRYTLFSPRPPTSMVFHALVCQAPGEPPQIVWTSLPSSSPMANLYDSLLTRVITEAIQRGDKAKQMMVAVELLRRSPTIPRGMATVAFLEYSSALAREGYPRAPIRTYAIFKQEMNLSRLERR